MLTSVGSDPTSDVRILGLPHRFAIVRRDGASVRVQLLESGKSTKLEPGVEVAIAGIRCTLLASVEDDESTPFEPVATALASVESTSEALRVLLRGVVRAADADVGAIVLVEAGRTDIAVAEHSDGRPLEKAETLLSDTIIADAMIGAGVNIDDASLDTRYRAMPSVVSLSLHAVVCVPMRLEGRALGAIYLGRHDVRRPFEPRVVRDVHVLATMAVPLLAQLRRPAPVAAAPDAGILGESQAIANVRRLVDRVASSDLSVLVDGETGTGKELVARAIHAASTRASGPFIALNCAAVPESLLAAELFGAKKGAFTGAVSDRIGLVERAHHGTLFLDEVGDMPAAMQASLLRVLELREVVRLGESEPRPVDVRFVAATHRDLSREVREGRFREDLVYRLAEVRVPLPPLRSREGDAEWLARVFLRRAADEIARRPLELSSDAVDAIRVHRWPGNVRELRATIRRAALLTDDGVVRAPDLGLGERAEHAEHAPPTSDLGDLARTLDDARNDYSRRYALAVLEREGGNRERAAVALGISLRTLYRVLASEVDG